MLNGPDKSNTPSLLSPITPDIQSKLNYLYLQRGEMFGVESTPVELEGLGSMGITFGNVESGIVRDCHMNIPVANKKERVAVTLKGNTFKIPNHTENQINLTEIFDMIKID